MSDSRSGLVDMRFGLVFALLTLLFGFGLGGAFGAVESSIKGHLKATAQDVFETVYKSDEAAMKKVTSKSWVYFKRAHLHANGLGAVAVGVILLLTAVGAGKPRVFTALAVGVGSLGYSLYWMLAALKAPGMGSTGAAKESLEWLAVPSAGLCMFGLLAAVGLVLCALFCKPKPTAG